MQVNVPLLVLLFAQRRKSCQADTATTARTAASTQRRCVEGARLHALLYVELTGMVARQNDLSCKGDPSAVKFRIVHTSRSERTIRRLAASENEVPQKGMPVTRSRDATRRRAADSMPRMQHRRRRFATRHHAVLLGLVAVALALT